MKKNLVVGLAVVLALGVFGVAYAAWSQNLTLQAQVGTGNFELQWGENPVLTDNDPQKYAGASITRTAADTLTFSMPKAYPGWSGTITATIENKGTIPANIAKSISNPHADILEVVWPDSNPTEVGLGGKVDCVINVSVPLSVELLQNQSAGTYQFTITVTGTQFNVTP